MARSTLKERKQQVAKVVADALSDRFDYFTDLQHEQHNVTMADEFSYTVRFKEHDEPSQYVKVTITRGY